MISLAYLAHVLATELPDSLPYCVGGMLSDGRVCVHFMPDDSILMSNADLNKAWLRVVSVLPMTLRVEVTCRGRCKACRKPLDDDQKGFCNRPGDLCRHEWVAWQGRHTEEP